MKSLLGIFSVIALALLITQPRGLHAQTDEEIQQIRELYAKGQTLIKEEKLEESNKIFKEVLGKLPPQPPEKYDPNLDRILEDINGNYQALNKVDDAIKYLHEVFDKLPPAGAGQRAPNRETVLKKIHRNHVFKKDFTASNATLDKLLAYYPAPADGGLSLLRAHVLYARGANFSQLGEVDQAVRSLQSATQSGFWDYDMMSRDPQLNAIRSHAGFQVALATARRGVATVAHGLTDILSESVLNAEEYKGKVVILDIWGTWCPPCRMEIPHFIQLQKEYGDKGLRIVGLTWERANPTPQIRQTVQEFGRSTGVNYPLVLLTQSRLSAIPNVRSFPTTLFVGRDGAVRERISGYHDYAALKTRVERLLRDPVPTAVGGGD